MSRQLLAAIIPLVLSSLVIVDAGDGKRAAPDVKLNILYDPDRLSDRPQDVSAAWLTYGLGRAAWLDKHVLNKKDVVSTYRRSFEEELEGRRMLLEAWRGFKKTSAGLSDSYLDQLQAVDQAGFLKEYVWTFLKGDNWQVPQSLQLAEFDSWRKAELPAHTVETWGDVVVEVSPSRRGSPE